MQEIGEVVKQFVLHISPLNYAIKGRITRYGSARFEWEISHNYQPSLQAGVYYPSRTSHSSLDEAEASFKAYAGSFVPNIRVEANEYY